MTDNQLTNDITIEEVRHICANTSSMKFRLNYKECTQREIVALLSKQLLATMQREAKLREALEAADTELRKLGRSESNNTRIRIKEALASEYRGIP